eukprot:scaffold139642_cov36-Cyclotella_meneghiniana.AAC.3
MSAVDPGEEFWGNLAAEQDFLDPDADDAWAHENEEFVDEDDDSSGCAVFDLSADGAYGLSLSPTTTVVADNDPPDASDYNVAEVSFLKKISMILMFCSPNSHPHPMPPGPQEADEMPTSSYLSAEISELYIERPFKETIITRDTLTEVYREPVTFNRGIDHKRKKVTIQYACGSRRRTKKCTTDKVLLKRKNGKDMDYSDYCRMCLRMQPDNDYYKSLTNKQRQRLCNNSRTGCPQCKEPICDSCWPKYDKHKEKLE